MIVSQNHYLNQILDVHPLNEDDHENFNCDAADADENVGKKFTFHQAISPRSEWPEESRGDQEAEGRCVGGPPEGDAPQPAHDPH